ncbi:MAG: type 1 glutamine amidotransferase, partial [Actinomycetota bacterium]|nr:type 1 glutamine amidotransferase [Actinomycetota bacterium]
MTGSGQARAYVVTHSATEHVGTFGTWLPEAGLALDVANPWDGEPLLDRVGPDVTGHAALVVMGGPQQAYDDTSAPWLAQTKALLRAAVADGVPVLGVCLGGQLLAEATGGVVERGAEGPELGARLVATRDVAREDPLFWDVPLSPVVVQWHWDAVTELPPGAVLLASSPRYPHQAFRVGERAWGLQFHLETPPEMVRGWADADADAVRAAGLDPEAVAARTVAELPEVEDVWRPVLERFAA